MRKCLAVSLGALLVVAVVGVLVQTPAQAYYQSLPAGTCTPYDSTIQNDRYEYASTGSDVAFKGSDSNHVYLVCPVNGFDQLDAPTLKIWYKDPSSTAGVYASAELEKRSKSTGTITAACSVTSTTGTSWPSSALESSCGTLTLDSNFFWIFVDLDRTSSLEDVHLYFVDLYI